MRIRLTEAALEVAERISFFGGGEQLVAVICGSIAKHVQATRHERYEMEARHASEAAGGGGS